MMDYNNAMEELKCALWCCNSFSTVYHLEVAVANTGIIIIMYDDWSYSF